MGEILSLTAPIFILIAIGFGAARFGAVSADFVGGLGAFVLNFALPGLILHALLGQDFAATFDLDYVIAYAGGSLAVFALLILVFRALLRRDMARSAMSSLGSVVSNSGFVGFPLASVAIGPTALVVLPMCILVETALMIPLALALAETGSRDGRSLGAALRQPFLRLARMPLIWAIAAGVVLSVAGVHPPAVIGTVIGMLADAAVACALFVVGGTLAGLGAAEIGADTGLVAVGKLVLHPLAVTAAFLIVGGVPPLLMITGIVFASAPMITTYPIFAQRFGLQRSCAAALLVTTAASFVTMSVVIGLTKDIASAETPNVVSFVSQAPDCAGERPKSFDTPAPRAGHCTMNAGGTDDR